MDKAEKLWKTDKALAQMYYLWAQGYARDEEYPNKMAPLIVAIRQVLKDTDV